MAMVDGGELFVRVIERAGLDTVFTIHGGHLEPIFQAALDRGLRLVDVRHEAAAGHAAEGYARTTGRCAIAAVTAGPGFANVLTSMVNAHLDATPVLFVAGAPPLREAEMNPLQGGFDQVAMAVPVTKWAARVTRTELVPHMLAQAIRIARSGRPGPVFLEIPIDVLFDRVEADGVRIPSSIAVEPAQAPPPALVERALAVLREARRPVVLAGGGALYAGAGEELRRFVAAAGIPVFTNNRAHGIVPPQDPLACGPFANLAALAMDGGERPDAALVLGARLGLYTGGTSEMLLPAQLRIVQVDVEAREIGRLRDVEVGINADCRLTLAALNAAAGAWSDRSAWRARCAGAAAAQREQLAGAAGDGGVPIHPYRVAHTIAAVAGPEAIVVADGGETQNWNEIAQRAGAPGRFLTLGYLGCLGIGMPLAVGAQVAHPDRRVICAVGDGAVGFNIAEFDTMVRHELPVVVVVFNNQSWLMSEHGQALTVGDNRRVVTSLLASDYHQVAAGFGGHGERVEDPAELRPALERALASGRPACVNVIVDKRPVCPLTLAFVGAIRDEMGPAAGGGGDEIVLPYYENLKSD